MSAAIDLPMVAPGPKRRRILLVETDPAVVAAVRWILEEDGHEIVVHFSDTGVAERIRAERADLVLVDPRLPWLSAAELERVLDLREGVRPVPVVLFCEGNEFELRALARRHRAFGHVAKGEMAKLRRRVRAFLDLD